MQPSLKSGLSALFTQSMQQQSPEEGWPHTPAMAERVISAPHTQHCMHTPSRPHGLLTKRCYQTALDTSLIRLSIRHQRILMDVKIKVKVAQSCPTLCNPMDYTVHGILQDTILEWVHFSRGSSQPRDQTQVSLIAGRFLTS